MKKFGSCSLSVLLALSAFTGAAQASVVYSYVGNYYTQFTNATDATYTAAMRITGSFTLADGAWANLSNTTISPLSYDFFDGRRSYNQGNVDSTIFRLSTNAAGEVTNWMVYLSDSGPGGITGYELLYTTQDIDMAERVNYNVCYSACVSRGVVYDQGSWTVTGLTALPPPEPATVPEPQTLALLMVGFGGLALTRRRRRPARLSRALGVAVGLAMTAGSASASFVYTYTAKIPFVFEFETASALATGAEIALLATPDAFNPTPNILSWAFSAGAVSFDSDSAGAVLYPLYVLLTATGDLYRICGGGSLAGVGAFAMNNAETPGGMLTGTRCSNWHDNYDALTLTGGGGGFERGLGTWSVREVTAPPSPSGVPEPATLALAAAALIALRVSRRPARPV